MADLLYKTGWLHAHAGNKRSAVRFLRESLKRRAFAPKTWAAVLLFSIPGDLGARAHRRLSHLVAARRGPSGQGSI
jgi:hypothetical protein